MVLIACVDDGMGMTFHHRRQSQDRLLRQRVLARTEGTLWMSEYSARQFSDCPASRIGVGKLPQQLERGEAYFAESPEGLAEAAVERIVLYRWNRRYPADTVFPFDLTSPVWRLTERTEFSGYSHDKLTEEVYERCSV